MSGSPTGLRVAGLRVAVLGATGLVGREILTVLHERRFPVAELVPLASARSAGTRVPFGGKEIEVRLAAPEAFSGVDLVLASAGGDASRALLPEAAASGALCVDNSSTFRMETDVPLVVPEVNAHVLQSRPARGIVANPNCSTIQLVVTLAPIREAVGLRRVRVATYQSVSGAGAHALAELDRQTRATLAGEPCQARVLAHPIAFDVLPHIDVFTPDGSTREEWKMRVETRKILDLDVPIDATCVRVPVMRAHSEAVWIETESPISPDDLRALLRAAPGIQVVDDPAMAAYPTARSAAFRDDVLVGRIRRDESAENGLSLWVVADNLRKGAATNAVQIGEELLARGHLRGA